MNSFSEKLISNVDKVIVGKDKHIEQLLVALALPAHGVNCIRAADRRDDPAVQRVRV